MESKKDLINIQRQQKNEENKDKARQKYLENFKNFKNQEYYNPEKDQINAKQYFSQFLEKQEELNYNNLNKLLSSTFQHAKRRENLFPIVDRHPDNTLKCLYTQEILETEKGEQLVKCDEEHCMPQSYQAGTNKGCGKDMHQMFAASKHANGSRGNKPFGQGILQNLLQENNENWYKISESESGKVYELKKSEKPDNIPLTENQLKIKTFSPKNNIGACARATLYIFVCYNKAIDENKFPKHLLQWVIEKAANEPVTLWEKHRNQEIFKLQKNRNPFIDFPEWANYIDFENSFQDKKQQ